MAKKAAVLAFVLLSASLGLAAGARTKAQPKTWIGHARYHTLRTLRALDNEMQAAMAAMRRGMTDLRDGTAEGAADLTKAGRRGLSSVHKATAQAARRAMRDTHDTFLVAARAVVPVGTQPEKRAVAEGEKITSPCLDAGFLRGHDILVAWHIDIGDVAMRTSLVLEDRVLLETADQDVYSFDPRSGILQWLYGLPGASQGAYSADENHIFVVANDTFYELDRLIGRPRRRMILQFPAASPPTVERDFVIISSWERRIYAMNRETRVKEWTFVPDANVTGAVAVVPNRMYVGDLGGKLSVYSAATRRVEWNYQAHDAIRVSLVLDKDAILFPAEDFFIHCVNRFAGRAKWKVAVQGLVRRPVVVDGDRVYFSADGDAFYCVSREDGAEHWRVPKGGWPVAVGTSSIYIEGPDKAVWSIDRKTGAKQWAISCKPFSYLVPNATNDYIYLCGERGEVYALYLRGDHIEKKAPRKEGEGEEPEPEPAAPAAEEPEPATAPAAEAELP